MYKSISAWAFSPGRPLDEIFVIAKATGFDAVEVVIGEDGPITPASTADECAEIMAVANSVGVRLSGLASGLGWQYPVTSTNSAAAAKARGLVASSLHVAQMLGIDAILVVPGGVGASFIPSFDGAPYDVAYDNLVASLAELRAVAEERKTAIAIENVWNMFLLSPLEFRDMLDKIASDYVGLYFDVGNVIATGFPEQWVRILGRRIKRVHLKDFVRSTGTLAGFCDLFEGDVDFTKVMAELRKTGYDGPLTAEFFNCEDKLPAISSAIDRILSM